ncbi:Xaa-Pro dipeptidase [Natronospira proteinivora]|uniref:Xaa-Pro dipeptidase n=1 Tax=Natronospira proteinivora TaxID=1807133 RepID=A0ABT1GBP4_9GAMM|nr:Xaa-Pro dipeptidase [Natronospira proteinivora]MCP1727342.1 Xaa-Pro dipeptidase [Natronospira proteinivora]
MQQAPTRDADHLAHIDTVRRRFDDAMAAHEVPCVVIASGGVAQRFLDDIAYPFKVNPLFNYWVPLTQHPDSYLIYRRGETPRLLLHAPEDFWHKTPEAPQGAWTEAFEIESHGEADAMEKALSDLEDAVFLGEQPPEALQSRPRNPEGLLNHLHYYRAWKTTYELDCQREANRLGALGHRAAEAGFRDGASEFELHQAFCTACGHTQNDLPYPGIIALNANGSTLHYDRLERETPETHRAFLIDAGAGYAGYASDITRTYSGGDKGFADLIDAVDAMQRELCDLVRPGVSFGELHDQTHRRVARLLADWAFITVSADEAFDSGLTRRFFPHGLGHFIGLQVHDVGGHMGGPDGRRAPPPEAHPHLRTTRELDTDQTLTIEPGVYFIDNLLDPIRDTDEGKAVNWEQVDEFRPFGGVRIEDDIRVTADGHENMTRNAFNKVQAGG